MRLKIALTALALAGFGAMSALPAWAQTTAKTATSKPMDKLSSEYVEFSGSQQNADALSNGLRTGKSITLVASPDSANPLAPPATFVPATSKLGIGEINIALSLAKADLAKQGITNPTPAQLAAALNGGTISTTNGTTVTMAGVLAERRSGMGWGDIANSMGFKLGALISASKTDKAGKEKNADAMNAGASSKASTRGKSGQAHPSSPGNSGGGNGGGGNSHTSSGGGGSGGGGGGGGGGGRGK